MGLAGLAIPSPNLGRHPVQTQSWRDHPPARDRAVDRSRQPVPHCHLDLMSVHPGPATRG